MKTATEILQENVDFYLELEEVAKIVKAMEEYAKQSNKQESTNSDLEDRAAIYLEEMNISGDTMVQMNHHLDDVPKDKIGAYYLQDLMAGFVQEQLNILHVSNNEVAVCDNCHRNPVLRYDQTTGLDLCSDCYRKAN